ncbi:MAG: FAD-dependent oxidoreductase, partial [Gammaproteobacteria bacterium]|nr:FAD-dependent oxidoreductase [Gammaproteobacteria bacterium]
EDPDVSAFLQKAFDRRGICVIPESRYESLTVNKSSVTTHLTTGDIETSVVLLAVGREACSSELNLEAAGVEFDKRGYIPTTGEMRTNVSHIYAVGDVGYRNTPVDLSLVHVAQAEGRLAVAHMLGQPVPQNMDHVPFIIFTIPMIAGAGFTETEARQKFGEVRVGKYPYGRNHRAHTIQPPVGFVKLIVAPEGDDRIVGIRAVGKDADTIVGTASIMIERSLPYTYLMESIFPHPSLLECLQGAAHIIAGDALSYLDGEEFSFLNS